MGCFVSKSADSDDPSQHVNLGVALLQMRTNPQVPHTSEASITEIPTAAGTALKFTVNAEGLVLDYPNAKETITLGNARGEVVETIKLDNERLAGKLLKNSGERAELISIAMGTNDPIWVAVPGSKRTDLAKSEGTVNDLALAIANASGWPVAVELKGES